MFRKWAFAGVPAPGVPFQFHILIIHPDHAWIRLQKINLLFFHLIFSKLP